MTTAAALTQDGAADASLAYLAARLTIVETQVTTAIAARRDTDPNPDDPFRGLYLTDESVTWLVERPSDLPTDLTSQNDTRLAAEAVADAAEHRGGRIRLRELARRFGLSDVDTDLLLVAMLPDVDARFEQLYGYLNDDVTRRRPSAGLALQLCGLPTSAGRARARLLDSSPLVIGGLLTLDEPDRPFLSRELRVPDRVVAHLLGGDVPDQAVEGVLDDEPPPVRSAVVSRLGEALAGGMTVVYTRDVLGGSGRAVAASALRHAGLSVLAVDLARLLPSPEPVALAAQLVREARLVGAGMVAELPSGADPAVADVLRRLCRGLAPVMIVGSVTWDPSWSAVSPLIVEAPDFLPSDRESLWRSVLDDPPEDVVAATLPFVLSPDGVVRAADSARREAQYYGVDVGAEHLRRGARHQNAAGLERLARRIEPAVGWDDLVLPPIVLSQLHEIALRARHRERVLGEWKMRPGGGRGRGVTALFAGDSGTGKTMSAEVIAGDLGLDLYTVDLATVVDKYVGETEKNLERIFAEAAGVNGVLLFDEADAIFGKRSEVKDAHDRYANIESAYLLQRMESFDGLAILATNLRANLDDAFTRRLDIILDFPNPDIDQRRELWDKCLGDALPRADGLDLDFCAEAFDITGGSIRSIAVTAAYLAADSDGRISMEILIGAVQREYRKLGRLILPSEFSEARIGRNNDDRPTSGRSR